MAAHYRLKDSAAAHITLAAQDTPATAPTSETKLGRRPGRPAARAVGARLRHPQRIGSDGLPGCVTSIHKPTTERRARQPQRRRGRCIAD